MVTGVPHGFGHAEHSMPRENHRESTEKRVAIPASHCSLVRCRQSGSSKPGSQVGACWGTELPSSRGPSEEFGSARTHVI